MSKALTIIFLVIGLLIAAIAFSISLYNLLAVELTDKEELNYLATLLVAVIYLYNQVIEGQLLREIDEINKNND